jgi:hypothetical protein
VTRMAAHRGASATKKLRRTSCSTDRGCQKDMIGHTEGIEGRDCNVALGERECSILMVSQIKMP